MSLAVDSRPVFITGGRGCLAEVLGRSLGAEGRVVTRLSRTADTGFLPLGSLFDPATLAGAGVLLHLAWSTVPYSAEQTPGLEQVHDLPLLSRLLDTLGALPREQRPHLVFFSSGGTVYGDCRDQPHGETDPCQPIGKHGRAKLDAEKLIEQKGRALGLAWTILRISNPYGFPVPAGRRQGIIPVAINAARSGQPLTIWGDGTARKDFLHHSDFSRAISLVVRQRPAGTFNLCSGESHSVFEILQLVEQNTGKKIAVQHVAAHPWDVHDSQLDPRKLCAALAWRPAVGLAEGIHRTAEELKR